MEVELGELVVDPEVVEPLVPVEPDGVAVLVDPEGAVDMLDEGVEPVEVEPPVEVPPVDVPPPDLPPEDVVGAGDATLVWPPERVTDPLVLTL